MSKWSYSSIKNNLVYRRTVDWFTHLFIFSFTHWKLTQNVYK